MLRPVLMTCAIRPTCTASDKITINDTLDSGKARSGPASIVKPALVQAAISSVPNLALGYPDLALHLAALAPADVRQRIAEHVLRAGIHRHFHLATVESQRRTGGFLGEEPHVDLLGRGGVDL